VCFACPLEISSSATDLAVPPGIANPMPTFPSTVPPWICALTPTTFPSGRGEGPPELPWLIAASVWIASGIVRPLGAWISRPTALTIPAVMVRSSPNGFPIAVHRIADLHRVRFERERMEGRCRRLDTHDGDVARRVRADDGGGVRASAGEADADRARAGYDVVVRDDVALRIDDEAGSERADLLLLGGE
jgi:hypothetical protein